MKALTLLLLMNMFSGMGYSIVAPLFPSLGEKYSISESLLGWIISTYAISDSIITPFIPSLCKIFTRIKLLYFSTLFEATCTILYGFLQYINSYYLLLIIVFCLRILHGICAAFIGTLVYSITCSLASEKEIKTALGNLEIGISIGTSSGPLFASFFYHIGGYTLPFLVLGLFLYISVFITKIIGKEKIDSNEEMQEDPPFFKIIKHLDILVIFSSFIFAMIACVFFYPCLTNHLIKNYNMTVSSSSIFFAIPLICYFIMLQFLNLISDKIGLFSSVSLGLFLMSIGTMFIYPLPPIPKNIISIIIGLCLIGTGGPPVYVPGLIALCKIIKNINNNIDENTANDISSAINNLSISIGDFLGPILGGFFTTNFGFKRCCIIISLTMLSFFLIFTFYFYKNIKEDINTNLFTSKKLVKNDKEMKIKDKLNNSFNFKNNSLSLNFQYVRSRKYSYHKNNTNEKKSLFLSLND